METRKAGEKTYDIHAVILHQYLLPTKSELIMKKGPKAHIITM